VAIPFELFLALRYLRPKRTFVSVISVLSLLGVLLGVMVLILVISVMSGFERDLRDKVMGFTAHVTLTNYSIMEVPEAVSIAEKNKDVLGASPFVQGPVLVDVGGRISTPLLRGVEAGREESVSGLKRYLVQGDFLLEGEAVIVGQRFAERNNLMIGDRITVFAPKNIQSMLQQARDGEKTAFLPSELIVSGIFCTGMYEYDANVVLVGLDMARELYNLGQGVHGIALRLRDPMAAQGIRDSLNAQLPPPIRAYTWMDLNHQLFAAIAVERNVMFFLLLFIVIVAAFGLSSTLITITVQKAREIGALKALGADDGQVLRIFLWYGIIVGVLGSFLGLGTGLFLLRFRNEFAGFLAKTLGIEIFPSEIYYFEAIPAEVNEANLAAICLCAILLCALAALIPAWNAARLPPARALRYE
jgi:lipoprotein-releasing system permease protein